MKYENTVLKIMVDINIIDIIDIIDTVDTVDIINIIVIAQIRLDESLAVCVSLAGRHRARPHGVRVLQGARGFSRRTVPGRRKPHRRRCC